MAGRRWLLRLAVLASGCVFQSTGCAVIAADALSGLTVAIANEFIRNSLTQALGLGGLVT